MKTRYWVGLAGEGKREVFSASQTPTRDSHGATYMAVIGPFKTKRGAEFDAKYGFGNPHCQCVDDAERLAKIKKP